MKMKTNKNFYCDAADYSGLERCKQQCEACKELDEESIATAKMIGELNELQQELKSLKNDLES